MMISVGFMKMNKVAFVCLLMICGLSIAAQGGLKPIAVELDFQKQYNSIEKVHFFHRADAPGLEQRHLDYISDQKYYEVNTAAINSILAEQPSLLEFSLPGFNDLPVDFEVYRADVFAAGYQLRTSDGRTLGRQGNYAFYRGTIKGEPNSLVILTIFEGELRLLVSDSRTNYRVQKTEEDLYVAFDEEDIRVQKPFECGVDDNYVYDHPEEENIQGRTSSSGNCVEIYFETDLATYQEQNSSVAQTESYIVAIFNEVATLYENEDIPISISEIFVWTTTDPYAGLNSTIAILNEFTDQVASNGYNGRLAHFVSTRSGGGVAWLDVLCSTTIPTAVSMGLSQSVTPFPNYSWNVEVVAHEMGHNFGSRHTHHCSWNGNNTQIDDCGNVYSDNNDSTIEGAACYNASNPIIPSSGTIMSYCHLLSGVGISFNNGFGVQPGNKIRSEYNTASCNTGSCFPPECTSLSDPEPGETGVVRDPLISWEVVPGATGYTLSLGSTPNGTDFLAAEEISGGSSFQSPDLPENTTIYVTIVPYNSLGNASPCSSQSFVTGSGFTYCSSAGIYQWAGYIDQVSFNGTVNNTSSSQYSDFTNIEFTGYPGGSFPISISPDYPGDIFPFYYRVWIDYNNDGDFGDSGETVYSKSSTTQTASGTITIPANVSAGSKQMRVSMKNGSYASSCGNFNFGEVEDYTLVINAVSCNLVTNTNSSGEGSLLGVIGCAEPGTTILFSSQLDGQTINLNAQYPTINKDLTIVVAQSRNIRIAGNNAQHVFEVLEGNEVEIGGFRLIAGNGNEGAIISNHGNLTLSNVILQENPFGNSGNLIYNDGTLQFEGNCSFEQ